MLKKSYEYLYEEYPEYITKDQFYRICKVSKKTALFYLQNNLIPAVDSGKKTRRYKIAIKDVVTLLKDRDQDPYKYQASPGWYSKKGSTGGKSNRPKYQIIRIRDTDDCKQQLEKWLDTYPDLMTVDQVSKATGYVKATVNGWCSDAILQNFYVRRSYLIPKISLFEFMLSNAFEGIKVKYEEYESMLNEFQS